MKYRNFIWSAIGWITIALVAVSSWIYSNQNGLFSYSTTLISGNVFYTDEEIVSLLDIEDGTSIFLLQQEDIQNTVNNLEYIYTSNISILPPAALVIQISERSPLVYIKNSEDLFLIDNTGNVLSVTEKVKNHFKAPIIEKTELQPYSDLYQTEFNIKDYSGLIKLIKSTKEFYPEFYNKITFIKQLSDDIEFYYGRNDTRILLTRKNAISELSNIREFENVIRSKMKFENYKYIDARIPDQIIVKERRKFL